MQRAWGPPLFFWPPSLPQEQGPRRVLQNRRRGLYCLRVGNRASDIIVIAYVRREPRKHYERRGDPRRSCDTGDSQRLSLAIPPPGDATQSNQAGAEEEQRGRLGDRGDRVRIDEHTNSL